MSKLCKIISILSSIVGLLAVGLGLMIKMRAKRDVMAASIAILLVLAAVLFFRHRT